jgi:hypothetical protein
MPTGSVAAMALAMMRRRTGLHGYHGSTPRHRKNSATDGVRLLTVRESSALWRSLLRGRSTTRGLMCRYQSGRSGMKVSEAEAADVAAGHPLWTR